MSVALDKLALLGGPLPNAEVYYGYLQRGKQYAISVLTSGGMVASKGVTVTAKLKKFFLVTTGTQDLKEITAAQWEALWEKLEALAREGNKQAAEAVENICCTCNEQSSSVMVAAATREQPTVTLEINGAEVDLAVPEPAPWQGTIAAWSDEVARTSAEVANVQFYFGDLINQGVAAFGEVAAYAQATVVAGCEPETLRFYAWVARKVPPARRVKQLTFNHHRAVAALEPVHQATLLSRAVEEKLSVKAVQQIAACKPTSLTPSTLPTGRAVHCLVPGSIYKDLEQFAADFECTVDEVVQRAVVQFILARRQAARQELASYQATAEGRSG